MAGIALPSDFADLLETLELSKFYPEKLSRDNLYEITRHSLKAERSCSLPWQFIYDLSRYNYRARNLQTAGDFNTNVPSMGLREMRYKKMEQRQRSVHPLDIIVSIFLCCEPTARQDLVMHLWGCKLAIPFIIKPSRTEKLKAFIWPLRCLVAQLNDEEMPLVDIKAKTISFIRIGENENISKSNLINCFIGGPEKAHPIFFQRDSEGSKKSRSSVVNGLVEIGWFLPKGSKEDKFSSPRLFLNLRGNAIELLEQIEIISDMSTVTVVVCTRESLKNSDSESIIRCLLNKSSSVLVLLSDKNTNENEIDMILEKYHDTPSKSFDVIETNGLRLGDILKYLKDMIEKMEKGANKEKSLKNIFRSSYISIDEKESQYKDAFESTDLIMKCIKDISVDNRKENILPLQEIYWKKWAKLDRDLHRFSQLETQVKEKYGDQKSVEEEMKKVRKKQIRHINNHKHFLPMERFLTALISMEKTRRRIFLRYFKLELDNLSRVLMVPFYREYHELLLKQDNVSNEEQRTEVLKKLSNLDTRRTNISLGLEHFAREMGQIFEAYQSVNSKSTQIRKSTIYHDHLPSAACVLLEEGYPLEILDGEAASVPLSWVKRILAVLPQRIKNENNLSDLRVHVISVLGIQSSGKSTFLNALFGLQFKVSAGRCTRGAFMQLVKIGTDLKEKLDTDYVLAIDTEGLRSAELTSNEYIKQDNELSTFVIGLADTTVINLMGENASYLQDNLPIAVHAFLRMNLVGLHPRCIIVHHNVDKRNREKLLQQGHFLESTLNRLTQMACEIEKSPSKLFKDIIEFNISNYTDYIPALLEGERPMAPISTGYSSEADLVRAKLISFVQPSSDLSKLGQFSRHLENLWTAIKRDRFVYEFKTTLETEARINLDNHYFIILDKYVRKLEQVNINIIKEIDAKKNVQKFIDKYLKETKELEKKYMNKLSEFFDKPKKVKTERTNAWEKEYKNNFQKAFEQNKTSDIKAIEICYKQKKGSDFDRAELERFFTLYAKNSSIYDEQTAFDNSWVDSLSKRQHSVLKDTENALHTVCPAHKYLLSEKDILGSVLVRFHPSVQKHINNPGKSDTSDDSLLQKMNSIKETVLTVYNTELKCIDQTKLPYSHRKPLTILLAVEKHLQKRLSAEDSNNEIKNIFRIDILLCTAGSCVTDLKKMNVKNEEKHRNTLKSKMQQLVKKSNDNEGDAISVLREILKHSVSHLLSLNTTAMFRKCLSKSIVQDKQSLLGNCLKSIVSDKKDDLLLKYVHFPEEAIVSYLKEIIVSVSKTRQFKEESRTLFEQEREAMNQTVTDILDENNRYISVKDFFQHIIGKSNLQQSDKDLFLFTVENRKAYQEPLVIFDNILSKLNLSGIFKDCFDIYMTEILTDAKLTATVKEMSTILIGCQEQCPFCKELCRYTDQHPDKHECYIHRPVGCVGMHWHKTEQLSYETCSQHVENRNRFWHKGDWVSFCDHEKVYPKWKLSTRNPAEPSLIWKFIFVKKYSILKKEFKLPDNLPGDWNSIEEFEALRELNSQFRLETAV